MGNAFFDKYSFVHFISGIVAFMLGIPLHTWTVLHILFEYFENTKEGVHFIDTKLKPVWPGGKQKSDMLVNSIGDVFFGTVGWYVAQKVMRK